MDARINWDINEMFELRRKGWSYAALGRKYKKDHTTMMHHCRINRIVPLVPVFYQREVATKNCKKTIVVSVSNLLPELPKPKEYKYDHLINELMKPGKTYKQYLKEALKRPAERHYDNVFGDAYRVKSEME